jgi:hypothetical protein
MEIMPVQRPVIFKSLPPYTNLASWYTAFLQ